MSNFTGYGLYSRGAWKAPVRYSLVRSRQSYMFCGFAKNKLHLPRLLLSVFLHLLVAKTARSVTVLDKSALRGHIATVSPTFNFKLPSHYPQRHSHDKIFHAFCTASNKSCAEAWERGYSYTTSTDGLVKTMQCYPNSPSASHCPFAVASPLQPTNRVPIARDYWPRCARQ